MTADTAPILSRPSCSPLTRRTTRIRDFAAPSQDPELENLAHPDIAMR